MTAALPAGCKLTTFACRTGLEGAATCLVFAAPARAAGFDRSSRIAVSVRISGAGARASDRDDASSDGNTLRDQAR